jgi:hypothetical protein
MGAGVDMCRTMNSDPTTHVPYVPRTQLPKVGYTLMNASATGILANACPMSLLLKHKWGIKYVHKNASNGIEGGFFEEMARQRVGTKAAFGKGLYAVSVQTQHAHLALLENQCYTLDFADPENQQSQRQPVVIKTLHMHKDNRVAWVWLE